MAKDYRDWRRRSLYAGVPSLLVSQWSVDYTATLRLMTDVLRACASNSKTSRAWVLQTGMRELMSEEAKGDYAYYAHPYAWAPFFILGAGGPASNEVARIALFLAGDASAGVTGQSINVDAGIAMN